MQRIKGIKVESNIIIKNIYEKVKVNCIVHIANAKVPYTPMLVALQDNPKTTEITA